MYASGRSFQKSVVISPITLTTSILLSAAGWLLAFLWHPVAGATETIGAFVLYCLIGYLLIELNNSFAIIHLRASVQTAVYLLLVTACNDLHCLYAGNIMALLLLMAVYLLFRSYQNFSSAGYLMHVFLLLGGCSLVRPWFLYLTLVCWMAAYSFQSLNARSFAASLLGLALPYLAVDAYSIYMGEGDIMLQAIKALFSFSVPQYNLIAVCTLVYVILWFFVCAVYILQNDYDQKIRVRCYLHFIIEACLLMLLLMMAQPQSLNTFLPSLLMLLSILIGQYIVATNSRFSHRFFIAMLVGLAALFMCTIWMA